MEGEDQIIRRYIEADDENRLSLFLSYPPLRNRFIDIDLNEKKTRQDKEKENASEKSFWIEGGKSGTFLTN